MQNEDLTHVADEKIFNLRICPYCLLERSSKPMTPSNFMQTTNHSILSGTEKITYPLNDSKTDQSNMQSKEDAQQNAAAASKIINFENLKT